MTAKTKSPKAVVKDARPEPSESIKREAAAATERLRAAIKEREDVRSHMPAMKAAFPGAQTCKVGSPHADDHGWSAQLMEALGVCDPRVAYYLLSSALNGGFGRAPTDIATADNFAWAVETAMAFVAEAQPNGPIEAALVLQMAAAHKASMTLARHSERAEMRDALLDYNRMMNQTMRTFTAQAEALQKLRTGGKQQVEVRYVYVDARTQTVVSAGGLPGGGPEILDQPHAPGGVLGHALAPGLPMRSTDESGNALPVPGGEGASALPDARRPKSRSATRRSQRELCGRPLDAGNHHGPGNSAGNGQDVQGDAA